MSRLIDDAVTRWDVNFVLGELLGELNASHAYRGGGDLERLAAQLDAAPADIGARLAYGKALIAAGRREQGLEELLRAIAPQPMCLIVEAVDQVPAEALGSLVSVAVESRNLLLVFTRERPETEHLGDARIAALGDARFAIVGRRLIAFLGDCDAALFL